MTLHLVTGSDDNYAAGVLVLIASAAFHTPGLRATVLDNGISAANRARIDALGQRLGIAVDRVEVASDAVAGLPVRRGHLTASTYLRMLIPALMPKAERVLYMDCDMVAMDDLSPLATLPLGDSIVAAVPDPAPDAAELAATGIARGAYVNAGLLVMNLPVWRAEDVAGRCLALLADPARPLRSEDQSALNIAAAGRILPLPGRYNVYADPSAYRDPATLPADPAVLHYVVGRKPWVGQAVVMDDVWDWHAGRIAALMPPLSRPGLARQLSALNAQRKLWMGVAAGRRKYRIQAQVRAEMRRQGHAYLAAQAARAPG